MNDDRDSEVIVIGWDRTGAYKKNNLNISFVYPVQFPENPKDANGILIYFQQYRHMWNCFRALIRPMWKLRHKYDYIHNFNSGFAFNRVSIFIGKILGKKVITETSLIGDDDPLSLGRFPDWKDYFKPKLVRYLFYKMADKYVSKSGFMTKIFQKSSIPMNKVAEVPYSVNTQKYFPLENKDKKELRRRLQIWEDGIIITFVGGINVRKGVHLLLDAFIQVEKKYPEIRLLIVGPTYKYDQKYINELKEKIKSLNLGNKILMTEKNVSNVDEYMKCSDIFVLPSRQEGFPISIIEAMSCGLAVIGSDIPEISETQIINGEDGYVFPVGKSESLSQKIESLIKDKNNIVKFGKAARKKALNNWSDEIVDKSYKEIYMTLAKESEILIEKS